MYQTCLFCSASLGSNDAIESFPVGARIAFDGWKGRLWAVCGRCGRWNLAPIEERWEAVEAAEKLFVDCRSRVHAEHIGLARLPDGTRLIRVGEALPGELAAWRYGSQLISRRYRSWAAFGAVIVGGGAVLAGVPLLASAGIPAAAVSVGLQGIGALQYYREQERVVHVLSAAESPTGAELLIRRRHLYHATLAQAADAGAEGELALEVEPVLDPRRYYRRQGHIPAFRLVGPQARRVVARAMLDYNHRGARREDVSAALQTIEAAGGAELFARQVGGSGAVIVRPHRYNRPRRPAPTLRQIVGTFRGEVLPVRPYRDPFSADDRPRLTQTDALALEMALNEEAERQALEGELAALEAAWREAEVIACIADALPGEPDQTPTG